MRVEAVTAGLAAAWFYVLVGVRSFCSKHVGIPHVQVSSPLPHESVTVNLY